MLGDEKKLDSGDMFHVFNIDELIPPNHLLRKLDAVLDTSWVRKEVADCYSDRGRPSWDPEVIIRMILLGYLYDLSEVRLVDELRMHMGYRWFCRLQPSDPVPDRITLVKIRNEKWKSDIWRKDDGEGACLAYLGNFCIDTKSRIVLGAEASPGRTSGEWIAGINMLDFVGSVLGFMPKILTADKGYGVVPFYSEVEKRGIISHIPTRNRTSETHLPKSRLLAMKTVPFDRAKKMIARRRGIKARNRVQRIKNTRGYRISRLLRLRVEHKIGEAKECHGLRRARHRGLDKVDHQVKITAAIMNLKQLAKLGGRTLGASVSHASSVVGRFLANRTRFTIMLIEVIDQIIETGPRRLFATGHSSQGF